MGRMRAGRLSVSASPGAQNYVDTILHRNNTLVPGGLLYKDDPTVLAWELQNEPQLREGFELCATSRPAGHPCTALHALHPGAPSDSLEQQVDLCDTPRAHDMQGRRKTRHGRTSQRAPDLQSTDPSSSDL